MLARNSVVCSDRFLLTFLLQFPEINNHRHTSLYHRFTACAQLIFQHINNNMVQVHTCPTIINDKNRNYNTIITTDDGYLSKTSISFKKHYLELLINKK